MKKRTGFILMAGLVGLLSSPLSAFGSTVIDLIDDRITLSGAVWTRPDYPGTPEKSSYSYQGKTRNQGGILSLEKEIGCNVPEYYEGIPGEDSYRLAGNHVGGTFTGSGFFLWGISITDRSPNAGASIGGIARMELDWQFRVSGKDDSLHLNADGNEGSLRVKFLDETENTGFDVEYLNGNSLYLPFLNQHRYSLQITAFADSSNGWGDPGPNFELSSSAIVTPEPPAWLLVGGGLIGFIVFAGNKRKRAFLDS